MAVRFESVKKWRKIIGHGEADRAPIQNEELDLATAGWLRRQLALCSEAIFLARVVPLGWRLSKHDDRLSHLAAVPKW